MNAPLTRTRRYDGGAIIKAFAWSYSALKNWRACPKRHYHVDKKKEFKEDESEALRFGNVLHKAAADWLEKGTEPPPVHRPFIEPWCNKLRAMPGKLMVEQQLAITEDMQPCEWFAKEAWFRAKADAMVINGPVAVAIDWKTGKIIEEIEQLALMAQCIFSHHPQVQRIRTVFVWVKEDAETVEDFTRESMLTVWSNLWPDVEAMKVAHATTTYPPTPSYLCEKWCPVASCPHHGKRP